MADPKETEELVATPEFSEIDRLCQEIAEHGAQIHDLTKRVLELRSERDEALRHLRKQQSRFSKLERAYRHQVKAGPDEVLKLRQDSSKKAVEIRRLKAERIQLVELLEVSVDGGTTGVESVDKLLAERRQQRHRSDIAEFAELVARYLLMHRQKAGEVSDG